ncbi:hypothetical protein diail_10894 [Diaporthe ilicicola]|nr:hypothetical protein diail_10894 [Diaporthe ilicicola]
MQLKNGIYYISTVYTSPWGERWVQRNTTEDKSLMPKPVAVQLEAGAAEWVLEQTDDDKFKLSVGTSDLSQDPAGTVGQDGKLFADLTGAPAQNWTVTECQTCEEDVFIITDDNGTTWQTTQSDDDDPQACFHNEHYPFKKCGIILIDDLIIAMIYPPKYPAYAQFKFAFADDVDRE